MKVEKKTFGIMGIDDKWSSKGRWDLLRKGVEYEEETKHNPGKK